MTVPAVLTLTVTVNGATIGTYNKYAHSDLEGFLRPGPNTIALTFSAPGTATTGASLHCLPRSRPPCAASSSNCTPPRDS